MRTEACTSRETNGTSLGANIPPVGFSQKTIDHVVNHALSYNHVCVLFM